MRHLAFFPLALFFLVLAGCATVGQDTTMVSVVNDKNHLAVADSISGSMPLVDWTDFTVRQERAKAEIVLWRQATKAAGQGKLEETQKYSELAQDLSVSNCTRAKLVNASSYLLTVLDGPFAGITLAPGQSSNKEERVPVGTLSFSVNWGHGKTSLIVRQVSAGQKKVVIVNK